MAPQDRDGEPDQDEPGGEREHAGDVAVVGAVDADVLDVHRAVDHGERAEQERERGPQRRSTAAEREHGAGRAGDRDQRGERVLGEVDAGLAVQEGVVERVEDRDPDGRAEHGELGDAAAADRGHAATIPGAGARGR